MDIGIKRVINNYKYVYMFGVICVSPVEEKFKYYPPNATPEEIDYSEYIVEDVVNLSGDKLFQLSTIDKHILNVMDMIKELNLYDKEDN